MSRQPTTGHSAVFRPSAANSHADGRMVSGTFERNAKPVIDGLSSFLEGRKGNALEIGSGTGQHIIAFSKAFPDLLWTPSDPDEIHRISIDAWRAHNSAATNLALDIDAAANWSSTGPVKAITPLQLVMSMNVIHIAPLEVAQGIISGAGQSLTPGGLLVFYGPFSENGRHTGQGNATFDQRLRDDNPAWGVRDIDEIMKSGEDAGLKSESLMEMPANNRLLILKRPLI